MKRLMILGAGDEQIPLINKARELGLTTIVVDGQPERPGAKLGDEFLQIDILDEAACIAAARVGAIDGITTSVLSQGIRTLGAVAEALNLPGLRRESAFAVTNKIEMRKRLAAANVPSLPFAVATSAAQAHQHAIAMGMPLIFKPPDGSGSRGVHVVERLEQVDSAYQEAVAAVRSTRPDAHSVLIEQFVRGSNYGSEGIIIDGHPHFLTIREMLLTPLPYRQELGYVFPVQQPPGFESRLAAYIERVARALGLDRVPFHADFIYDGSTFVLLEIGARMPGYGLSYSFIPHATGLDFYTLVIQLALGETILVPEPKRNPTAMLFLRPMPGIVHKLPVLEPLRNEPSVVHFACNLAPGDHIPEVTDGASALKSGFVVTKGSTVDHALRNAQEIVRRFQQGLVYATEE